MRNLLTLALFAASAIAQTVTVNLSVPMQASVVADIHQHYISLVAGTLGATSANMDATSTSITITLDQSKLTAAAPVYAVGNAVLLEAEPMTLTAIDGLRLTFARGGFPNVALSTHASGSTVSLLKYASPWAMLMDEALRPWTLAVIQALGPRSATLASGITGSLQ